MSRGPEPTARPAGRCRTALSRTRIVWAGAVLLLLLGLVVGLGPVAALAPGITLTAPASVLVRSSVTLTAAFQSESPPGSESPGSESPGSESPGSQSPGSESPGSESPGSESPGSESPGSESPGSESPGSESPGSEPPGSEPPGSEPPASESPASESPASESPASGPPAPESPASGPPAPESPAPESPAETTTTEPPVILRAREEGSGDGSSSAPAMTFTIRGANAQTLVDDTPTEDGTYSVTYRADNQGEDTVVAGAAEAFSQPATIEITPPPEQVGADFQQDSATSSVDTRLNLTMTITPADGSDTGCCSVRAGSRAGVTMTVSGKNGSRELEVSGGPERYTAGYV